MRVPKRAREGRGELSSLIVGPPGVDEAVAAGPRRSRLFRLNDAALIVLLMVPQLVWLGVVAYLLNRHH
jgi:hypothetical protein